jgi:hypothetical protein
MILKLEHEDSPKWISLKLKWTVTKPLHGASCLSTRQLSILMTKLIAIICTHGEWGKALEHRRDLLKVNIYCALSQNQAYSPFFLARNTVSRVICLELLQNWLMLHLTEHDNTFIL